MLELINNFLGSGDEKSFWHLQQAMGGGSTFGKDLSTRASNRQEQKQQKQKQKQIEDEVMFDGEDEAEKSTKSGPDVSKVTQIFANELGELRLDPDFTGSATQIEYLRSILANQAT
jgi:hypothetical protein